jgi:hypothetical protein
MCGMKIKGSAIKIGETVHWGTSIHACLVNEAFDMGLFPKLTAEEMTDADWTYFYGMGYEEGFVLEDDTFVDRFEAAKIAVKEKQIDCIGECYREKELHLPDVCWSLA